VTAARDGRVSCVCKAGGGRLTGARVRRPASMLKTLVLAALTWAGCIHDAAPAQPAAPRPTPGSLATQLIPPAPGPFPFERIPLRGAAVEDVAKAYGVAVAADGWTDLIGERWPRRTEDGWSLGVEAHAGRVIAATVVFPAQSSRGEADAVAALRARLGKPSQLGACWHSCEWPAEGITLTTHNTRLDNWMILTLD
jgi:hypothetical protein